MKKLYTTIVIALLGINSFGQAPNYAWAKQIGGNVSDAFGHTCTDLNGNVYLTGDFCEPTINIGGTTLTNTGYQNFFIAKFNSAGNLIWAKSPSGTATNSSKGIKTDPFGNVYIVGEFGLSSSPSTIIFGSITLTNTIPGSSIFIVKYDSTGNEIWAQSAGGSGSEEVLGLSIDSNSNAFVTGYFTGTTFTSGSLSITNFSASYEDVFIMKIDPTGNTIWAKDAGGNDNDRGLSISNDLSGNVYVTGFFRSSSISFFSTTLTGIGTANSFVVKYSNTGTMIWAKLIDGNGYVYANSVCNDNSGNVCIAGTFTGATAIFGTTTLTNTGGAQNIFVAKYNSSGTIVWANNSGGTYYCDANSITSDSYNNIYFAGTFKNQYFVFDTITLINDTTNASLDAYLLKLNSVGNPLWGVSIGGSKDERANSIAVDLYSNVYITGYFFSHSITFGSSNFINNDNTMNTADIYFAKLGSATTTSIAEHNNLKNILEVFPNPSSGVFTIINVEDKSNIKVYNLMGEVIFESLSSNKIMTIDLRNQTKGIYFLNYITNNKTDECKKIIIN